MFQHHYTTFSHHNSFWPIDTEDNGNPTNKSLNVWTQTPLNVDFVRANRMPITDAYAAAALTEHKTVYHYIRDHLGYRLELHSVDIEVDADLGIDGSDSDGAPAIATDANGDARQMQATAASATPTLSVTLRLNNRGFSAPINRRSMEFVLIKVNNGAGGAGGASFTGNPTGTIGDVVWSGRPTNAATGKEADWRDWQPHTPGDPLFVQCNHTIMLSGGGCRPRCRRVPTTSASPSESLWSLGAVRATQSSFQTTTWSTGCNCKGRTAVRVAARRRDATVIVTATVTVRVNAMGEAVTTAPPFLEMSSYNNIFFVSVSRQTLHFYD